MAAPISSALAPRPNGSGLNRSFQLSAFPVRSSAFLFIRPTSRSVATGPRIDRNDADAVLRTHAAERLGESDSAAFPATPQIYSGSCVCGRIADHVDDHAVLSLLHQCVESPAHVDIAKHFQIPGFRQVASSTFSRVPPGMAPALFTRISMSG